MAKDLEEALTNIEVKLGGEKQPLKDLGEHLEYIESLIGGGSSSDLPEPQAGDEGKAVLVNSSADGFELGTVSSGTKLYKHTIYAYKDTKGETHQYDIVIINTNQTQITQNTFENKLKNCVSYYGYKSGFSNGPLVGFDNTRCYYALTSSVSYELFSNFASEEFDTFTDTVTPL